MFLAFEYQFLISLVFDLNPNILDKELQKSKVKLCLHVCIFIVHLVFILAFTIDTKISINRLKSCTAKLI